MTIEIAPELEEVIQQQLATGKFRDAADVVGQAVRGSVPVEGKKVEAGMRSGVTGADLIAAMQKCPYPDVEFEQPRYSSPVRDVILP
jgi:Arc/MetJ-type ribon-helix-helix transcriptional regulator